MNLAALQRGLALLAKLTPEERKKLLDGVTERALAAQRKESIPMAQAEGMTYEELEREMNGE